MSGHLERRTVLSSTKGDDSGGTLSDWEALVVDAVGNTIDFWHFKRNHGRVWALLYLRGHGLSAGDLQESLGLSKGAVSMVTRELEQWGVIHRQRRPGDATWRFVAESELMKMICRVITDREAVFVSRVREDLEAAEATARSRKDVPPEVLARVVRMKTLAMLVDKALKAFVRTARLDVLDVADILKEPEPKPPKKKR
ncbi:MAG: MarR family transcriptional regulator [Deltaproteobacteria bacterium]|nr:MarR family transcriptional regulator [Deltaproteobacteria bacterium]